MTVNHGPAAATKNVGQQHFSRMRCLYLQVTHGIKMDGINAHHRVNPRAPHGETRMRSRVAATFPGFSLHFDKHERNASTETVHHDNAIRLGTVRIFNVINDNIQNLSQPWT